MAFVLHPPRLKKWTRETSTRAASFRVFGVDKHAMRDGEGRLRGDFFTFACSDWCNVIAITDAAEIVFVWQYRFGTDDFSLEIPGGVVDEGETPLESARRELLEETGFEADEWSPLVAVAANPALQGNACHTFVARGARRVAAPSFDADEELEEVLVPVAHLARLLDEGRVAHGLVAGALETFLRREGLARSLGRR
jgi:8-oxo-dGTP pyrophosphatase MutT (NUDIX family)